MSPPVPLTPRPVLAAELPLLESSVARAVLKAVLTAWGPWIEVRGAHHLRSAPEPAVFALSHNNSLEALLAPAVLLYLRRGRPVRFLIDWMFLHLPPVGWITRLGQPIPVWTKPARWGLWESFRRQHLRSSPLEEAEAALAKGDSVGIFPEGTRNPDPRRLLPGRRGLGRLALKAGVPVVPVGLDFPARHRLGRPPRLGRLRMAVGQPLDFTAEAERWRRAEGRPDRRRALETSAVERVMQRLAPLAAKRPPARRPEPRTTPRGE